MRHLDYGHVLKRHMIETIFQIALTSLNFILMFSNFSTLQTALATLFPSNGSVINQEKGITY